MNYENAVVCQGDVASRKSGSGKRLSSKRVSGKRGPIPGSPAEPALSREALRLLQALAVQGTRMRSDPFDPDRILLSKGGEFRRDGSAVSLGGGSFARSALDLLIRHDLVQQDPLQHDRAITSRDRADSTAATLISQAGKGYLARLAARRAGQGDEAFAVQHRVAVMADRPDPVDDGAQARVRVNQEESPLAWLAARKGADGAPLIDAAQFEAGERFRRDLTMAGIMPGVSIDWDRLGSGGGGGGGNRAGRLDATEACIAARQRVTRAVRHLGAEDGDLLIDVCGFLIRISEIERARAWPARSGKIMIARALSRLADYYGLAGEARGAVRNRRILAWCAGESVAPG